MEFKISKSGRTRNVRVLSSSFAGTPAGDCVVKTVKRWKFPSYTGKSPPPVRIPLKM
jgi:TonB family protein